MLIFIIPLVICASIQGVVCINLTYIVTKNGNKIKPSCIAEERERYVAIGWIYPMPENENELPNITTKYIPHIENDFNCNFSSQNKCNKIWAIKNWASQETFQLLLDTRWEDLPTIFTGKNKEFKERIEIPNVFNISFSVRSLSDVEILLCEGWNPSNYPCYHVLIGQFDIYLRKYATFPNNHSNNDINIEYYKTFSPILSNDEWRNFIVTFNNHGILGLKDVSSNRTVIEHADKNPLKPLYMLMKSTDAAVWKVHKNEFIQTRSQQLSRFGPVLDIVSKNLCISLFASVCEYCVMNFIMMKNGKKIILKQISSSTEDFEWQFIKLKHENVGANKVTLFVETKIIDSSANQSAFWAIDDVRVCHENEVKVTFLNLSSDENHNDTNISCQIVYHPKWRPKKIEFSEIDDISRIESSTDETTANITWAQQDSLRRINYFISYQANDICEAEPYNLARIKSNGFLITKDNEVMIDDLIPYTKYNIKISSVLHENEKNFYVTTAESKSPTPGELPNKVQIQVTDTHAYISWEKVDCTSIYGPLIYSIKIKNTVLNKTRDIKVQTENFIEIDGLEPFTTYTLNILTARNFENIESNTNVLELNINFTTHAGVAPPVRNLEIYSTDKNSVSFRYDLPPKSNGVPTQIQISRCNPILFKKCKSSIFKVTPCKIWPRKFCLEMDNLISEQRHTFKISIRNDLTNVFGKEVQLDAFTTDQVPGQPTNITYKIVDCKEVLEYCHMNISWLHPYNQNGTINAFNIVLNSTDGNITKNINEVYRITNKTYLAQYEYQVKYIPYSTHYELFIQSANAKFKSPFSHVHVKTDDLGDHIDQKPKLVDLSSNSATFELPLVDHRLQSYKLLTVIQDFDNHRKVDEKALKNKRIADHLCHNFGNTWILDSFEVKNDTREFTIDKYLKQKTQYCITFIVINKYNGAEHDVIYYEKLTTGEEESVPQTTTTSYNWLYLLLLLLLLIPIGFYIYRNMNRRRRRRPNNRNIEQPNKENIYESMPFEECEENCVNNETYDQLLHK